MNTTQNETPTPVNPADPGTNDARDLERASGDGMPEPTADAFVPKDPPVMPDPVPEPPGGFRAAPVVPQAGSVAGRATPPISAPEGRIAQATRMETEALEAQNRKRGA